MKKIYIYILISLIILTGIIILIKRDNILYSKKVTSETKDINITFKT